MPSVLTPSFQLKQAEAWAQFSDSLRDLNNNPLLQSIDFSVGFGRLENLALQELSVDLDLEVYQASWLKQTWWGLISLFGVPPPDKKSVFRLCQSGSKAKNRLNLSFKARRNEAGKWEIDKPALPEEVAAHV